MIPHQMKITRNGQVNNKMKRKGHQARIQLILGSNRQVAILEMKRTLTGHVILEMQIQMVIARLPSQILPQAIEESRERQIIQKDKLNKLIKLYTKKKLSNKNRRSHQRENPKHKTKIFISRYKINKSKRSQRIIRQLYGRIRIRRILHSHNFSNLFTLNKILCQNLKIWQISINNSYWYRNKQGAQAE